MPFDGALHGRFDTPATGFTKRRPKCMIRCTRRENTFESLPGGQGKDCLFRSDSFQRREVVKRYPSEPGRVLAEEVINTRIHFW